jgi:Ca2+-binding RTX toxin-like protein
MPKANCEHIIQQAAVVDPTKGISWQAPSTYGNASKTGTERNDRLLGRHNRHITLRGLGGNDLLWLDASQLATPRSSLQQGYGYGGGGDDTMFAGRGRSYLYGEAGNDTIQSNGKYSYLNGGNGDDLLRARSGTKYTKIVGGSGNDVVSAVIGSGRAVVDCGPGHDVLTLSQYKGNRARVSYKNCEKIVTE